MDYMHCYHPTSYLYPVSSDCGRSRQYTSVDDAVSVLMNIPHYLEFLIWRMSCRGDGILEKKCISFCDQLKWCHYYASCLSCTSLSAYLYDGFLETVKTSESTVLEFQIFQRPWTLWTKPLLKLLRMEI